MEKIIAFVSFLIALSIASERLVEIIKNLIPPLNTAQDDPTKEGLRRAALQIMAVGAGVFTAWLAQPAMQGVLPQAYTSPAGLLAIGLLASGGSGLWNSILAYLLNVKDLAKLSVSEAQRKIKERTR